jgi:hypothetical protein
MSKHKSRGHAIELPSPPEIVCTLVVDAIIDEIEIEICCQRTDGVDRVFSTSMDWLRAERPSEYALAYSVETLLFSIIARCVRYVGEPACRAESSREVQRPVGLSGHGNATRGARAMS